jgi:hypothetical protein
VLFLEAHVRQLLLLHLVLGAAAVASTTHLVVWLRGYRRGRFARHRSARRFAWIAAALVGANVAVGCLLYPTYKVRVRAEYLDNPMAVSRAQESRAAVRERMAERLGQAAVGPDDSGPDAVDGAARLGLWFDIKEHGAAFALALLVACAALLTFWDPRDDGDALAPVVVGFAWAAASTGWFVALIGAIVTSFRAVGALPG